MAQGTWSREEQSYSIYLLELRVFKLALWHFQPTLEGQHVLVCTDNMTAKAYVNQQGRTRIRTLNKEEACVIQWVEIHVKLLKVVHVPGQTNYLVDSLTTEKLDENKWSLNKEVFALICERFGDPEVEVFATSHNSQVPFFFCKMQVSRGNGNGHAEFSMATMSSVSSSAFQAPLKGDTESHSTEGRSHIDSSILAAETLVSGPEEASDTGPVDNLLMQGRIVHPNPRSLQLTTWRLNAEGF